LFSSSSLDLNLYTFAVDELKEMYDGLVVDLPLNVGKGTSKKERSELKLSAQSFVYSEIPWESFSVIIQKIKRRYGKSGVGSSGEYGILQGSGGIFYDLGSGKWCSIVLVLHLSSVVTRYYCTACLLVCICLSVNPFSTPLYLHFFGSFRDYTITYTYTHIYIPYTYTVGSGKCAVAAAVVHSFDSCCGIELLEGLFCLSLDTKAAFG
jgi:hypothetical protein